MRFSKANYNRNLIQENIDDSKSFWRAVNKVLPNRNNARQSITSIKVSDNFITAKLDQRSPRSYQQEPSLLNNDETQFTNEKFDLAPITSDVVCTFLRKLKTNKATGLDNIPAHLLKDGAPTVSECLTHIIDLSFASGVVPDDWKMFRVVPLFKSGKREEIDNYCKIAEKAVYHQLFKYLDTNNLLSPCQSGFWKNFSTETAVTFFVDNIHRNMDNGLITGAVFIDLKKAFDTIDHHLLLNKLQRYGICDRTLHWFSSYLQGRFQRVEVDKVLLSPLETVSGVPQGSILGPLLFILYINDMSSCVCFSNVMLYADDTVLFFAGKTAIELETSLNTDINNISSWMQENKLFLNMSKTEYVIDGSHGWISINKI